MTIPLDPPVDVAELMDRVAGDRALLAELLALFEEERPALRAAAAQAIATGDSTGLQRAGHTLKGAIGNFCAPEARRLAQALEAAGASGDLIAGAARLADLEASLDTLVAALRQLTVA